MNPRIVVVGLGPADEAMITRATFDAIAACPVRFVRTRRHPAVTVFDTIGGPAPTFLDDVYEGAARIGDVYPAIVDRITQAAREHGEVLYAVPGSPLVAERTVQLLGALDGVEVEIVPAMSFLDLTWPRLGVDPVDASVRLVDGHEFAAAAAGERGPFLVAQCDSTLVLGDIKLAVEDWPCEPVTVVHHLGLPDESIRQVEWADLDRIGEADHLTSLYIPRLTAPIGAELVRFDELVHQLRVGCPWDREQTHGSLRRYLIEECFELDEAIAALAPEGPDGSDGDAEYDDGDRAIEHFMEELGDVLFQVYLHSTIAAESGWFTLADVARSVHDKLHRRHPHVFGDARFDSPEEFSAEWEGIKAQEAAERGESPAAASEGIPAALPALLRASKILKRLHAAGVDVDSAVPSVPSAWESFAAAPDADSLGSLLLGVVLAARSQQLDAETALRDAGDRLA
ncbi:MAG: hypothetical protein KA129_10440 [Microthrixaceae bacterium]|jgi:tetrapyrrole methylase family protein/MazG family protein|nr:hypothetical protein [Microthrixaceae bacterium]